MTSYPKRPAFFANKFVRLLATQAVANEIGAPACWLLTVIVMTEDTRRYRGPVTYYNGVLAAQVGLGSVDALDRVRKKCVEAGWLAYIPGGRRVGAGRYWVMTPEQFDGIKDAPTEDVEEADDVTLLRENAEQTAEQSAEQTASKVRNLLPVPVPTPSAAVAAARTKAKKTPKEKKPRPADPLFDALVEVTGLDSKINGGYVGKLAAAFRSAEQPITPEEVRAFALVWRVLLPWAKPDQHPRLTLKIIENHLPPLRGELRATQADAQPCIKRAADNTLVNDRTVYAPL